MLGSQCGGQLRTLPRSDSLILALSHSRTHAVTPTPTFLSVSRPFFVVPYALCGSHIPLSVSLSPALLRNWLSLSHSCSYSRSISLTSFYHGFLSQSAPSFCFFHLLFLFSFSPPLLIIMTGMVVSVDFCIASLILLLPSFFGHSLPVPILLLFLALSRHCSCNCIDPSASLPASARSGMCFHQGQNCFTPRLPRHHGLKVKVGGGGEGEEGQRGRSNSSMRATRKNKTQTVRGRTDAEKQREHVVISASLSFFLSSSSLFVSV